MAFCDKCGAYIPIGETACPACGFDPEAEARAARKAEEEEKARKAAAAAEEFRRQQAAEAEAKRKAAEAESWAARERLRQEEERRRQQEARKWQQDPRQQQGYTGGAAQSQYASQRTGSARGSQSQYASQRTGQTWAPPWQETRDHGSTRRSAGSQTYGAGQSYEDMRRQASESADNQNLSILSYLGPLFMVPLITRKDDSFARYHANQGLALFLGTTAATVVGSAFGFGLLGLAANAFYVYGAIKGIGNVLKGKKEPLPLVGEWKLVDK